MAGSADFGELSPDVAQLDECLALNLLLMNWVGHFVPD